MNPRSVVTFLFFVLMVSGLKAGEVKVFGTAEELAGETITFHTYSDYITYEITDIFTLNVDENGNFESTFHIDYTAYVFSYLGIYEVFFYVKPGKEYQIEFPEKIERRMEDKLNPYYQYEYYHLGIVNSSEDELNYTIARFDDIYTTITNNAINEIAENGENTKVEKVTEFVDSIFQEVKDPFFNNYKKYRLAAYEYLSRYYKSKSISNKYFSNEDILYDHPAYMDLFNQIYKDYFTYFGRTNDGNKIYQDINEHASLKLLNNTLSQDSVLINPELKEMVILKCIYDEFYNDKFSRSSMLTILDSIIYTTDYDIHREIGGEIKRKIVKLLPGHEPPDFKLFDKDSNLVSLEDFKGKYLYLGFCATVSYACILEFEMLRNVYERHAEHFEIVIICLDENLSIMKDYLDKKSYPWLFLHYGNQPDIIKDYDIRALPTYYLIDDEGKLVMSPAPAAGEDLEQRLFKVFRSRGVL